MRRLRDQETQKLRDPEAPAMQGTPRDPETQRPRGPSYAGNKRPRDPGTQRPKDRTPRGKYSLTYAI